MRILVAQGTTYQGLGPGYFNRRQAERTIRRCVRTLKHLGLDDLGRFDVKGVHEPVHVFELIEGGP